VRQGGRPRKHADGASRYRAYRARKRARHETRDEPPCDETPRRNPRRKPSLPWRFGTQFSGGAQSTFSLWCCRRPSARDRKIAHGIKCGGPTVSGTRSRTGEAARELMAPSRLAWLRPAPPRSGVGQIGVG
jgi:hypothetical protein